MTLRTKKLTYREYLEAPEIKVRYDIVDEEMIMAPSPTYTHQAILRRTNRFVDRFVIDRQLGEVLFAPLDVIVQLEPLRVRQPDLLFVSNENRGILRDFVHGDPDLVMEILSPSNSRREIEAKLADYAALGVKECWLVSPEAQTVEVLILEQGAWTRLFIHGLGDEVESVVLPGLGLPVNEVFGRT
jgi:Uma2 family endonuclease